MHPFHTDGGPSLARIFPHPGSAVLTLKVQYFLTDVSRPGQGNMLVVPGHVRAFPEVPARIRALRSQAVPVLAEAGDAVVFPWLLWHGADAHAGDDVRASAVLRYSQLWSRPVDHSLQDPGVLARLSPRRRRLLGDLGPDPQPGDWYRPMTDEHLDLMLGDEWEDTRESRVWRGWERCAHEMYATQEKDAT